MLQSPTRTCARLSDPGSPGASHLKTEIIEPLGSTSAMPVAQQLSQDAQAKVTAATLLERLDLERLEVSNRLAVDPKRRAQLGQFFTPANVAHFMAAMLQVPRPPKELCLLDAGGGSGILTAAAVAAFCARPPSTRPDALHATVWEIDERLDTDLARTFKYCRGVCDAAGVRFTGFIADGAPWIWRRVQRLIAALGLSPTQVLGLIDFYHAAKQLSDAVKLRRWSATKRTRWLNRTRGLLKRARVDEVMGAVPRAHRRQDPHAPELLPEEPSSFRLHHNGRARASAGAAAPSKAPSVASSISASRAHPSIGCRRASTRFFSCGLSISPADGTVCSGWP